MTQFMLRSRGPQATVLANSEERFLSGREPRLMVVAGEVLETPLTGWMTETSYTCVS